MAGPFIAITVRQPGTLTLTTDGQWTFIPDNGEPVLGTWSDGTLFTDGTGWI